MGQYASLLCHAPLIHLHRSTAPSRIMHSSTIFYSPEAPLCHAISGKRLHRGLKGCDTEVETHPFRTRTVPSTHLSIVHLTFKIFLTLCHCVFQFLILLPNHIFLNHQTNLVLYNTSLKLFPSTKNLPPPSLKPTLLSLQTSSFPPTTKHPHLSQSQ